MIDQYQHNQRNIEKSIKWAIFPCYHINTPLHINRHTHTHTHTHTHQHISSLCLLFLLGMRITKVVKRFVTAGVRWCNGIVVWNRLGEPSSNPRQGYFNFRFSQILLVKVWIQLCSFQLWVNCKAHRDLQPWYGNWSRCSTMWFGCQSRRFNCLFWRETRQRILGYEISPYPEVVRGREWELTTRPRRESWWLESREKAVAAGQERGEQQRLAWIHGGAVNTRHRNREARRQDRVQWRRVSRCLIPVALWNFR